MLHADDVASPLSWGLRRRVIVLDARTIDPAVAVPLLAHELAHLARHDWVKLLFARVVTALMWFNPMVWWLARRCHQLREEAADDAVLHGTPAALEYAELLLNVARGHRARPVLAAHAMFSGGGAMRHLRRRLARVLDDTQRRAPAVRAWSLGSTALALAVALPVAALTPAAKVVTRDPGSTSPIDARGTPAVAATTTLTAAGRGPDTTAVDVASAIAATVDATPIVAATLTSGTLLANAGDEGDDADGARLSFVVAPRRAGDAGRVQLGMQDIGGRHRSSWSDDIALAQLQGLDTAAMANATPQPVRFALVRSAGRFDCAGTGQRRNATGFCDFTPDAAFARELERRGLGRAKPRELRLLALADARVDVLDELARQDYPAPDLERFIEFAIHDVDRAWLRELDGAGYRLKDLRRLVEFRIHDVDGAFIAALRDAGYADLPPERLVEFAIHDVTPAFVAQLAQLGYADLPPERIVEFAIHGVDAALVRALADAGYARLPAKRLVEFAIHDVTPDFIAELAKLGYTDLPPERVVEFAIQGVDAAMVRGLAEAGYPRLEPERLVEFAIHDVTPAFIREMSALGYRDIDARDLVAMQIHDVTPAWVRGKLAEYREPPSIHDLLEDRIRGD